MKAVTLMNDVNTSSTRANNRRSMIIAAVIFLVPILAAAILHKTGWYSSVGTTNSGNLITPPVAFEEIHLNTKNAQPLDPESFRKKWWLVYVLPEHCNQACNNSLFQMRQVHLALGPEQKRVSRLLVSTAELEQEIQHLVEQEFPKLSVAYADKTQLQKVFEQNQDKELSSNPLGRIYLVDTMGAVFMYYPTFVEEQESILKGRNLLKDLKKVLKLSKIG